MARIRHRVLYEFQKENNAAAACESICSIFGEGVVPYDACAFWFGWLKSGNFNLIDKQRPGGSRKCDDGDTEQPLTENSAQTHKEAR